MLESVEFPTLARNLGVYLAGVGIAVVGALGLIAVIELQAPLSGALFLFGLTLVIAVHEFLDGPF